MKVKLKTNEQASSQQKIEQPSTPTKTMIVPNGSVSFLKYLKNRTQTKVSK